MINFLPEWLKDYKRNKMKSRLKSIIIVFLLSDILIGYTSFSLFKKENVLNKKIDKFFAKKQTISLVSTSKTDNTYSTMKIALDESLSSYNFETLDVHNNEVDIMINFQNTKQLKELINKVEEKSVFKINSIAPSSQLQNLSKYKIGLEVVK